MLGLKLIYVGKRGPWDSAIVTDLGAWLTLHYSIILRPGQNGPNFAEVFKIIFKNWIIVLWCLFHWNLLLWVQLFRIGSNNGLTPNRRQALWTSDGQVRELSNEPLDLGEVYPLLLASMSPPVFTLHGGTTEEGNCSYLLPLSHRDGIADYLSITSS